jgi:hypothetical protein
MFSYWQDFRTSSQYKSPYMKHSVKNFISIGLFFLVVSFALTSCYETHYYNHYHHHTHGWYDRHHTPPPAGVKWDVDVDLR